MLNPSTNKLWHFSLMMAVAILLVTPTISSAELATPDEARIVCENYLFAHVSNKGDWAGSTSPTILDMSTFHKDGNILGYYFDIAPDGFIVVPALKSISPVKSNSEIGSIDFSKIGFPELLKEDLARTQSMFIDQFGSLDFAPTPELSFPFGTKDLALWTKYLLPKIEFSAVLPTLRSSTPAGTTSKNGLELLPSTWHQNPPYNNNCPTGDPVCTTCSTPNNRTVVGCVATATAQILYYHQWPQVGLGDKEYSWDGDDSCGNNNPSVDLSVTFSDGYDWANMLDDVLPTSPQVSRDAVAELCYEVGVAFEMNYGICSSGAITRKATSVLPKYFNYSKDISKEDKSDYSAQEWFDLIVEEIEQGRPMLYDIRYTDANGNDSGHAIVCDGWQDTQGSNEYHMNYGWDNGRTMWYTVDGLNESPYQEFLIKEIKPDYSDGATAYVLDRSGSMSGFPLFFTKSSANIGIAMKKKGSDIAVVSFSESARYDYPLHTITSNAIRQAAWSAVNGLRAIGGTSIGSGMLGGCLQVTQSMQYKKSILVLSDGRQTSGMTPQQALQTTCFQNFFNPLNTDLSPESSYNLPVHTIAFGAGADQQLLAGISAVTGGKFLYVASRNEPLALADLFLTIEGEISGDQRIGEFEGMISAPGTDSHNFNVGADLSEQTVTLVWDDTADDMDLVLVSPSGVQVDAANAEGLGITFVGGPAIEYFTIPEPELGQWTAQVVAVSGTMEYALVLSGQSTVVMDVDFDRDEYPRNTPITILATLNEDLTPITGATIIAEVLAPTAALAFFNSMNPPLSDVDPVDMPDLHLSADGMSYLDDQGNVLYSTITMPLLDDGAHNDGAPGDGVYANQYLDTASLGTYSFGVHAEGTSPSGTDFTRDASLATVVAVLPFVDPIADAGEDQTLECTGVNGAMATLNGSASYDPDGDPLTYTWMYEGAVIAGPMIDATTNFEFPMGDNLVELTVEDGMGATATDEVLISVLDTTPPEITVTVSPEVLWPSNHKMVDIEYTVTVSDVCDDMVSWELVDIVSNEPDNDLGDGNTEPDIMDADFGTTDTNVSLRAERSGEYTGRVYQATFQATDSSGNTSITMAMVHVPHDNTDIGTILSSGNGLPTVDSDVVFMVPGSSLWGKKTPVQLINTDETSHAEISVIKPISANICNTAGVIYPTAFFVKEIDNDGHQDVLMAFNRRSLVTLNTVSTEEDGIPVLALEIGDGRFIIMEMDDIQDTELDLNGLVKKMRSEGDIDDSLVQDNSGSGMPRQAGLIGAAPNPFNPSTTISYYIPDARHVELAIFDISGRLVDRLVSQTMVAGEHSVQWNGTDTRGSRVASGVYFYRMTAGSIVDTKRMILIK